MKQLKSILRKCIFLIAVLCITIQIYATEYSGTTGDCTYTLDTPEGTLVISGTGAMADYSSNSYVPWYSYRSYVKTVTIENGVTSIGDYAFLFCTSLTSITIGSGVTSIGDWAFCRCSSLTSVTSLATTPPTYTTDIGYPFESSTYSSATLYAASTDYATADYWGNFTNIVYDTSGNAISDIATEASTIRTVGSAIVITTEAAQTAQVYSLSGQLIVKQAVSAGETSIGMPTGGVYVVALADGTKAKVLVK